MDGDLDTIIELSDLALEKMREVCESENDPYAIRVAVRGGGCAGFMFDLSLKDSDLPGDRVLDYYLPHNKDKEGAEPDLKIYVDAMSMMYLPGTKIDYVDGLMGAGFKFTPPEGTKSTCGCGLSWS